MQEAFPSPVTTYMDGVMDPVEAYKMMLSSAEDKSVNIVSLGEPLTIRDLLMDSEGYDLFINKVKEIHYMDGRYNFGCGVSLGSGWSPYMGDTSDCNEAAKYVVETVPNTIRQVFSLEGDTVFIGHRYNNNCGYGPVKNAYDTYFEDPMMLDGAWDPISTYVSIMGTDSLWSSIINMVDIIDVDGNEFYDYQTPENDKNHWQFHIDFSHNGEVQDLLDDIICAAPCRGYKDVGACAGFDLHGSYNCLTDSEDYGVGKMTLARCMETCDNMIDCEAIVTVNKEDGNVDCHPQKAFSARNCVKQSGYDTWVRN